MHQVVVRPGTVSAQCRPQAAAERSQLCRPLPNRCVLSSRVQARRAGHPANARPSVATWRRSLHPKSSRRPLRPICVQAQDKASVGFSGQSRQAGTVYQARYSRHKRSAGLPQRRPAPRHPPYCRAKPTRGRRRKRPTPPPGSLASRPGSGRSSQQREPTARARASRCAQAPARSARPPACGALRLASPPAEPPAARPPTRCLQAKDLLKRYGSAYLITSISFAVVSFSTCYALVSAGETSRPLCPPHTSTHTHSHPHSHPPTSTHTTPGRTRSTSSPLARAAPLARRHEDADPTSGQHVLPAAGKQPVLPPPQAGRRP
jgi:hypothetical protein